MEIAEELAKHQKAISVAEFFEKNRQILGFDSAPRALITTVKEAVDNSLDACEESDILPDIFVQIMRRGEGFRVVVEDNGPGIVGSEVPRVFAKLLYGSRFHTLKQSRGQQGIGISAGVLYSQLTTGRPTAVTTRIGPTHGAGRWELMINTATNEPEILKTEETDWDRPHGTRVELEMEGSYVRSRRQSIYGYLKNVAIVNPHARITLIEPDGNVEVFERATDKLPRPSYEIKPHPWGMELGGLIKMLRYTDKKKLRVFLQGTFSSVGAIISSEICERAELDPEMAPQDLTHAEATRLLAAFKQMRLKSPPTDCLSPIGEDLIRAGLEKEYRVDFVATATRPVAVYSGNPFQVEVGLAYGGELKADGKVDVLRFANRVPLLYQQGGCAMTHAIENVSWKTYSLSQPGGGVPTGPVALIVHIASTNIPFTSESKDAVADVPEIVAEVELGLKEVGRKLRRYLSKKSALSERKEKEEIIRKLLPRISKKLAELLEREEPDINPVVAKIMGNLLVKRSIVSENGEAFVTLHVANYGDSACAFKLHETVSVEARSTEPPARVIPLGDGYDHLWKVSLRPGERQSISYTVPSEGVSFSEPVIEGVASELVSGAKVVG
ncbi:DNA topoisomerase VI subunit B [Methanotrichaceae archaeon M04Ac]|uniref:Type 2 DNA topoisomerase 6 subunit B n=1 Tax=Candidatus Methanocrinis alkalitolerans TaxID=3033395 RepID=A0ABT5XDW5_9EURY|nr:DNA topoisomerase VI subunit B [Candidatus Methanocrinis alkalitolerans]MCR3882758.1 DNA topoisomerase VI subunit B [Methanothrix sp.]MDF0592910.1 DNA topoisomerase VI subunit B [Candidatus Methanocrinis alkalitolerans]